MEERNDVTTTEQTREIGTARRPGRLARPLSDTFEDETGVTLYAEMPGVARDNLEIEVEGDTLTLEGHVSITLPDGVTPVHQEFSATGYRRSFTLGSELDPEAISASLKDGVVTLRIARRKESLPRKIAVQVH